MRKYTLLLLLALGLIGVANGQIMNESFTDYTSLPANFGSDGTLNNVTAWAGQDGVNINVNSAITYTHPSPLQLGDYILSINVNNQAADNYFDLQGWTTAPDYTTTNAEAAAGWVTLTKTINVTDANTVFGIVRGDGPSNNANRVIVNSWSITYDGPSNEANFTSFSIPEATGSATINDAAGTIALTVPYSTDLSNLTPTFALSPGATLISGTPASGSSGNFNSPVAYQVQAEDGTTTKNWTVTVNKAAPSSACDIIAFSIPEQISSITPSGTTINIDVDQFADLSAIFPSLTVSDGATINLVPGVAQDFTSGSRTYRVTAEDGTTFKDYTVNVNQTTITATPCSVKVP